MIERANPARPGEIVGRVRATAVAEIDAVVAAADEDFREWSRVPVADRVREIATAAVVLDDRREELAALLARESGKPVADCRGEIGFAAAYLRWVCARAPELCADSVIDDEQGRITVGQRPFGVVAAITPWNAPIILAAIKVGPALAAGNTVVLKPSPLAPLAVSRFAELLPRVRVVHGGPEVVRALAGHRLVRKVAFTGGEAAGASIAAEAGRALTPVVLELGGNDPAVFLDDFALGPADYERLVLASFATAGQVCMAAKRLYVPHARAAEFTDAYLAAAKRVLRVGDPLDESVTMGPVVDRAAAERITALIDDARRRGGRVHELAPSPGGPGWFVAPALVMGLPDDADLVRREQFGPAVPLLTYRDEAEVLTRANAGELGLGASVWSADEDRAFAFAAGFEAGFTFVNTHNRTGMSLRAPFGGVKRSGYGREYGDEGFREYVQTTVIHAPAAFRPGGAGMPARAYPQP
ncbi:aldehyde dehydrogenase family protein [Nocardia sp. NPDC003482]